MRFLLLTKNTENEILLFLIFDSFEKIFSQKIKTKIQSNTFSSPFSIFNKNKNKIQPNTKGTLNLPGSATVLYFSNALARLSVSSTLSKESL